MKVNDFVCLFMFYRLQEVYANRPISRHPNGCDMKTHDQAPSSRRRECDWGLVGGGGGWKNHGLPLLDVIWYYA